MTIEKNASNMSTVESLDIFYKQIVQACHQYFLSPNHFEKLIAESLRDREVLNTIVANQELTKYDHLHLEEYLLRQFKDILPSWINVAQRRAEIEKNKEELLKREKERKERERILLEKQKALEADPIYQAKQKAKVLLAKYEIVSYQPNFIVPTQLTEIINKLEAKQRLSEDEAIWLNTQGKEFFNSAVRVAFHRLEANFYLEQYQKNKNHVWHAINASSQLRKCKASLEAEDLLIGIQLKGKKDPKLLSAYFTTLGGVRRDLHKTKIAIENASKAHQLTPKNYRPCTLLGAIYMETYQYTLGHEWYEKASMLGAPDQSIQADLKSIIMKLDKAKRSEMIDHLLKLDAKTYQWLKTLKVHSIKARPSKKKEGSDSSAKNKQDTSLQNIPEPKHKVHTPKAKSAVNQLKK